MAKFLTPDENERLRKYWQRQAYEVYVKAQSGDMGISVESIRIRAMNDVLQMLGYDAKFHDDNNTYIEGERLYREGYRRRGGQLARVISPIVEDVI